MTDPTLAQEHAAAAQQSPAATDDQAAKGKGEDKGEGFV